MTIHITARRMFNSIVSLGISSIFPLSAVTFIVSVVKQRLIDLALVAVLTLVALLFFDNSTYGNASRFGVLTTEPINEIT